MLVNFYFYMGANSPQWEPIYNYNTVTGDYFTTGVKILTSHMGHDVIFVGG